MKASAIVEVADVNDKLWLSIAIIHKTPCRCILTSPSLIKNDFLAFFNRLQDYGLDNTVIFETMVDKVFASGLNDSQIAETLSEIVMSLDERTQCIKLYRYHLQQVFGQQTADSEVKNADNASTADSAPQAEITANLFVGYALI